MTTAVQTDRFDPERVIAWIHEVGQELGYARVRMDRGQYGGLRGPWYEVGYGCFEVKLRLGPVRGQTSSSWITHRSLIAADRDTVTQLLLSNLAVAGVPADLARPPILNPDELSRCVVCSGICDASGLCDEHKYDEQETRP